MAGRRCWNYFFSIWGKTGFSRQIMTGNGFNNILNEPDKNNYKGKTATVENITPSMDRFLILYTVLIQAIPIGH